MALIVHLRPDGSLALDGGSAVPDTHALPVQVLERWGVTPGHDFELTHGDETVTYTFSTFGRRISKGVEVADHKVLVYERVVADG